MHQPTEALVGSLVLFAGSACKSSVVVDWAWGPVVGFPPRNVGSETVDVILIEVCSENWLRVCCYSDGTFETSKSASLGFLWSTGRCFGPYWEDERVSLRAMTVLFGKAIGYDLYVRRCVKVLDFHDLVPSSAVKRDYSDEYACISFFIIFLFFPNFFDAAVGMNP
jgi:hypothetical protein